MPGPVSDSYDPEFGTAANAAEVAEAIRELLGRVTAAIGSPPRYILDVVRGDPGPAVELHLSERDARLIRFCLNWTQDHLMPSSLAGRPDPVALEFWMETRLREALDDPEAIGNALAMLKVAIQRGDTPSEMMRKVLADFVFGALGFDPTERG